MIRKIGTAVALGYSACVGVVMRCNVVIEGGTLIKMRQTIKDTALIIINKEYAEVSGELLVPEGVAVVEEAEVADEAERLALNLQGVACCCREATLNAVDAAIAIGRYGQAKVLIGPTDSGAIANEEGGEIIGLPAVNGRKGIVGGIA